MAAGAIANLAVGTLFGWSLVAPEVMTAVGVAPRRGSSVFALALAAFTVALLWVGRRPAGLGPRPLLGIAAVLAGGGLGLTAAGHRAELPWLGIGLLVGSANGLAYGVAAWLVARVRHGRRGLAGGLVVGAYATGPVGLGLLAPHVLPDAGWRTALAVLAVLVGGLVGVAALLVPGGLGGSAPGHEGTPVPVPRRTLVALWLLFAGGALPGLVVFATAAPLAAAAGLGTGAAGTGLSLLAAGNLVGRLGAGWWSDRVGRLPAVGTALAVGAVALIGWALPGGPGLVLGGFTGIGLAYGAVSALVPAATADLVGAPAFPRVYGVVFTAWGCSALAAPLLEGWGLVAGGPSPQLIGLLAVPSVVAGVALVVLSRAAYSGAGPDLPGAPRRTTGG